MSLRRVLTLLPALALLGAPANAFASADHYGLGDGHTGPLTVAAPNTVVNAYTALTADAAAAQAVLTVASGAAFGAGDLVLVWQEAGFAGTSGSQTAVDLTAAPVGRFELGRVASKTATTITLTETLVNAFKGGATQIVRVPEYTTVTINAASGITAPAWDGAVGGVVAFLATGAVTNAGSIDASAKGFRGGAVFENTGFFGCVALDGSPNAGYAPKGEGIDLAQFNVTTIGGRGNVAQGAGGGDCHNAGGGGGGNGGRGGVGGLTWPGAADNGGSRPVGGLGGAAITYSLMSRATFGGGGGAGDENNLVGTAGKPGGGLVFVRGLSLAGAGSILADGGSHTVRAGNDGAGGGGGGGSIVLRFHLAVACGALSAVGGAGCDAGDDSGQADGSGGGGGGGHVLVQASSSTCTPSVLAGLAGTQSNPGWAGGPFRGAGPTTTNDPTALGVIESAPVGGFPLLSVALSAPTNGSFTAQQKPPITGTCAPDGDPVDVYLDGVLAASVTCTNGAFSFTPPSNLALGAHTVSATLRDTANQLTSNPTPTNTFTIVACVTSGDCSGQTPVCDTGAHVCVQCLSNNQCSGGAPICDTSKTCRPCTSANANADCNGNGVCAEGSLDPRKGKCVQCTGNAQCTAPTICNTSSDTCVGCLVDAQCSNPKPVCGLGQTCTPCTWDADCAGRPATPACQAQSGSCVECTSQDATACRGTTPVCDATNSKCVGCNVDSDCKDGKTCLNQQCVAIGNDAGPVNPPDAGVDANGPTSPSGAAVEGGGLGCSASGGSLASAWPILGGLALALAGLTRRKNRR